MRYLLHGNTANRECDELPLVAELHGEDEEVWRKLAQAALTASNGGWRVVPTELSLLLAPEHRQQLGVEPVGPALASTLCRDVGPEFVSCDTLTEREREQLILGLDDDLLRQLRIHADACGELHSIGEKTYLETSEREGGFPADDPLSKCVTLIAASSDHKVKQRQRELIAPWTAQAAIRVALDQPEPHQYAGSILRALGILQEKGRQIEEELRKLTEVVK